MFERLAWIVSSLLLTLWCLPAAAYPAVYVGKSAGKRDLKTAHVVVARKGNVSAISLMADYGGPLDDFAVVTPVPDDVTLERVHTLKRDFLDRLDRMTAPRFHEFWEKDPCESGKAQQEWERSLKAESKTDFLGMPKVGSGEKVAKEMLLKVESEFKGTSAEFEYTLVPKDEPIVEWLEKNGYKPTPEIKKALGAVGSSAFLVGAVNSKKLELVAGGRGQLSPIRYWTEQPIDTLHTKLGLANLKGMQDVIVYVLHPDKRFEVKNYDNVIPPTNVQVRELRLHEKKIWVKERMSGIYAAVHDKLLEKNPKGVLVEFAASIDNCGQPCPTAALLPHEILSLGGDAFEEFVPEEEREPEPPEATDAEQKKLEAKQEGKTPKEKKELEEEFEERRKELARRKALIERNRFVVTRLHHRYDAAGHPENFQLAPAGHIEGGIAIPKGANAEMALDAKPADESFFQVRYVYAHVWKGMQKCEKPERWRWEKAPRTYRGRRDIWVAKELGTTNRNVVDLAEVIKTALPSIGLTGEVPPADAGADAGTDVAKEGGACGCRLPGRPSGSAAGAAVLLLGVLLRRRRR